MNAIIYIYTNRLHKKTSKETFLVHHIDIRNLIGRNIRTKYLKRNVKYANSSYVSKNLI